MLIASQGKSVRGTQQYFDQVLTQGDYYLGQEVAGQWHGQGTDLLDLESGSHVTKTQFNRLLAGSHPVTGKRLTQRQRSDRRPGMDLTFSVPKSVSLAWAINGDERIIDALRHTVHETMTHDVEPLMRRRVRAGKNVATKNATQTGTLIYADFLHKTSRPVDGSADPHLHIHAFVINWTEHQGKHYAGEFAEIVRRRPSIQARFEARLARRLQHELGYQVVRSRYRQAGRLKTGWEIDRIDRATIEKFSRRTAQVEQHAKEHGIHDPAAKGRLGKQTRQKKDTGQSMQQLRAEWRSRLSPQERSALAVPHKARHEHQRTSEQEAARQSVQYALDHHLYRQSTVERHQLVATALEHGVTLRPETVERAVDRMGLVQRTVDRDGDKRDVLTTREILTAEQKMLQYVRNGNGTRKAIGSTDYEVSRQWLNEQQQAAVKHLLASRDAVMAVVGGAGTGKSSLMEEAIEAMGKHGKNVHTFAPSTGAREVLETKGCTGAQTVEHLIRNTKLQQQLKGQVMWIDEAGLLDTRSMNELFRIARDQDARVVLSGDIRQHASPRRGEAMRLLENEGGLRPARIDVIQRQRGDYRRAVELIGKGNQVVDRQSGQTGLTAGFDLLDALGKIKEVDPGQAHAQLAKQYMAAVERDKSAIVIAPTHAEAQSATSEIRDLLRASGRLSGEEHPYSQLRSLNLSDAEKSDVRTYSASDDLVIQFHQNTQGGFGRGQRYRVIAASDKAVQLERMSDGQRRELPLQSADRFEVYSSHEIALAPGDQIRFSLGGMCRQGKRRISNGRLDEIKTIDRKGNLTLKSGIVVDRNYGHVDLGYVVTSHASQGKDRHVAIAAMGSQSLPAINARQFYVTVSRGREDVAVFVDNKARVRRAIQRSGEQLAATELTESASTEYSPSSSIGRFIEQGRAAWRSFRDRVSHWVRDRSNSGDVREEVSRHSQFGMGPMFGLEAAPSPGRSR